MSLITRTFTFTDGTTAYGSQVESEIANIVNTINNLDTATTKWDIVSILNSSSVPLVVDNSSGSNAIATFKANGVTKLTIDSTGGIQATTGCTTNLPMGTNKITGLGNGSASTDAAAFGQIPTVTSWASYTPTIGGVGTPSAVSFYWQQIGNHIWVKGFFTTGTCSGSGVSITLPSSNIDTSKVAANFYLGLAERLLASGGGTHAASQMFNVYYDGSTASVVRLTNNNGSNVFTSVAGTTLFTNGDSCSVFFDFPI